MAGIAAMVLAGILGTAMGLNNTATFMASCVAFVAVSLWMDSRISRRRSAAAQGRQRASGAGDAAADTPRPNDAGLTLRADGLKREPA